MSIAAFYFFSALVLLSAMGVVLAAQPVRALLCLIVTMAALSGLYALLHAPFIAMINLIVYAGAVLVLFLFVIMLQGIGARDVPLLQRFSFLQIAASILSAVFFAGMLLNLLPSQAPFNMANVEGTVEAIGRFLFTRYLLPFELISILLLLAIFAAVGLAKKDDTV